MSDEIKNIKDTLKDSVKDTSSMPASLALSIQDYSESYSKTNKLVIALYMVTDIMDKEEPLRNKLRALGTGIISDINLLKTSVLSRTPTQIQIKIEEVLSFLEIASTVGMISPMNCNILKKEFTNLKQSITESGQSSTLSELFSGENQSPPERLMSLSQTGIGHGKTRIGVQKGSTLMKALSRFEMSDKIPGTIRKNFGADSFDILKKQRRDEIIKIIKDKKEVNITDIKNLATGVLASCGEKTLQRELVSMVKDNILNKIGAKRWSRYFLSS